MLDQHATDLHVLTAYLPDTVAGVKVEGAGTTPVIPPAVTTLRRTVARAGVIVAVGSSEHHPVIVELRDRRTCQRIPGVSAVSGHTQLILTSLITDGERRVFRRVPLAAETLDLITATRHSRMYVTEVMDIAQRISGTDSRWHRECLWRKRNCLQLYAAV